MVLFMLIGAGLVFGSFVNALIWRLHEKRNWINERSECPHCHHQLAAKDLIPVLSWVLLRGKCRYCAEKIEDSPVVEISTAFLFVFSYLFWPVSLEGVGLFQFICWLVVLVGFMALIVYDLRWFLLPNKIVYPIIVFVAAHLVALPIFYHYSWREVGSAVLGALVLSGIFYVLFQVSKGEWIGGGDVKLAVALGLLAGDPMRSVLVLFFASFLGVVFSLPQLAEKKRKAMTAKVPFGPFLIIGLVIVQLFGTAIVDWYTHLFAV